MSIVFDKSELVLETLQKFLMDITIANKFNIEIKNVFLYDVSGWDKTPNASLPVILLLAEETIERDTNREFESDMTVQAFVKYQPEDQHNGIKTDFSKLRGAIGRQLDEHGCLDLGFVDKADIVAVEHPTYIDKRQAFVFKLTIDIEFVFDADSP